MKTAERDGLQVSARSFKCPDGIIRTLWEPCFTWMWADGLVKNGVWESIETEIEKMYCGAKLQEPYNPNIGIVMENDFFLHVHDHGTYYEKIHPEWDMFPKPLKYANL